MPFEQFAPPLHGPSLSAQHWQNLTFVHWPVDPVLLEPLMPSGVRPDVHGGCSYVGLVPFQMRGAGPARLPVPYFGSFCETNVRLYSVDAQDRHGIVFLTLEASRLATVLLARASLGLPYTWSAMNAHRRGDVVTYRSRRRWPRRSRRATSVVSVSIGPPTTPTEVETWLTSRWGLHTRVAGRTVWVPNEHDPWPLHEADLLDLDDDLVAASGVQTGDATMLRPLWSPGVRTVFGLPHRVR